MIAGEFRTLLEKDSMNMIPEKRYFLYNSCPKFFGILTISPEPNQSANFMTQILCTTMSNLLKRTTYIFQKLNHTESTYIRLFMKISNPKKYILYQGMLSLLQIRF